MSEEEFAYLMAMMMEEQMGPDEDEDFLRAISCGDLQSVKLELESRNVNDPITAKRMAPLYLASLNKQHGVACLFLETVLPSTCTTRTLA